MRLPGYTSAFLQHAKKNAMQRKPKAKKSPKPLSKKTLNPKRVMTGWSRGGSLALARRAAHDPLGRGATLPCGPASVAPRPKRSWAARRAKAKLPPLDHPVITLLGFRVFFDSGLGLLLLWAFVASHIHVCCSKRKCSLADAYLDHKSFWLRATKLRAPGRSEKHAPPQFLEVSFAHRATAPSLAAAAL